VCAREEVEGYLRRENFGREWILKEAWKAGLENAESWGNMSSKGVRHIIGSVEFGGLAMLDTKFTYSFLALLFAHLAACEGPIRDLTVSD
jgi:hypothetical protein